jgi:hypothetical protein
MKLIKTFSLAFVLTLINVTTMLADGTNPPPPQTARTASTNSVDPGGTDGLPIDQNIIFLMIGGLVLGTTVLYKDKIKKASM